MHLVQDYRLASPSPSRLPVTFFSPPSLPAPPLPARQASSMTPPLSPPYLRGRRFFMSQNTARPRLTSCFISRMRASRGQHLKVGGETEEDVRRTKGGRRVTTREAVVQLSALGTARPHPA